MTHHQPIVVSAFDVAATAARQGLEDIARARAELEEQEARLRSILDAATLPDVEAKSGAPVADPPQEPPAPSDSNGSTPDADPPAVGEDRANVDATVIDEVVGEWPDGIKPRDARGLVEGDAMWSENRWRNALKAALDRGYVEAVGKTNKRRLWPVGCVPLEDPPKAGAATRPRPRRPQHEARIEHSQVSEHRVPATAPARRRSTATGLDRRNGTLEGAILAHLSHFGPSRMQKLVREVMHGSPAGEYAQALRRLREEGEVMRHEDGTYSAVG